eukprot:g57696.t1
MLQTKQTKASRDQPASYESHHFRVVKASASANAETFCCETLLAWRHSIEQKSSKVELFRIWPEHCKLAFCITVTKTETRLETKTKKHEAKGFARTRSQRHDSVSSP